MRNLLFFALLIIFVPSPAQAQTMPGPVPGAGVDAKSQNALESLAVINDPSNQNEARYASSKNN